MDGEVKDCSFRQRNCGTRQRVERKTMGEVPSSSSPLAAGSSVNRHRTLDKKGNNVRLRSLERHVPQREYQDQDDELLALASIYDSDVFMREKCSGRFSAHVELLSPFVVRKETVEGGSSKGVQEFSVAHLPPITLFFHFPPDYPSKREPRFQLSCKWLNEEQLILLCRHLDSIWNEDKGSVVLFKWIVFLKEESLAHLRIVDVLDLSWTTNGTNKPYCGLATDRDPRAIQELKDINGLAALVSELLEYDEKKKEEIFVMSHFHCNVCFDEKIGSKCMRFKGCDHVYCRDCMKAYFEVQIAQGNVKCLTCPHDKCSSQAIPSQVRELVGCDLFAKYDQLLLTSTLDTMSDIAYCPRVACQCAVLLESGSTMASCPSCYFVFCIYCLMAYHGIEPCKFKSDERLKLYEAYVNGTTEGRNQLEARYGKVQLRRLVEAMMSETWMKENSKCCPQCRSQIEKLDGCNKMTCWKCNSYFCWLCMSRLNPTNPYSHYERRENGGCYGLLFLGTIDEFDEVEEEEEDDDDDELEYDVNDIGKFL